MEPIFAISLPALGTVAYLADRHAVLRLRRRLTAALIHAGVAFRRFNRDNVALWQAHGRAQRPWEATWLHWVHTTQGWHLEGSTIPPHKVRSHC